MFTHNFAMQNTLRFAVFFGLLLLPFFLKSQTTALQNTFPQTVVPGNASDSLRLRPLNELIDAALRNAPELNANRIDLAKQKLVAEVQRKSWADAVSMNGTAYYGNGTVNEIRSVDGANFDYASGRLGAGINLTLGVKLGGGDVFTRRQKTQIQVLQLDRLQSERQMIENEIRDEATAQYFQVENALAVVDLRAEALETLRLARTVADKFFQEGNLTVAEYTHLLTQETSAQEQFLRARNEAKLRSVALRNLTGGEIWVKE